MKSPHAPTAPKPGERDLYCLQCGYNLRGQAGDPRRCPECGYLNAIGDIEMPAAIISLQLRKMESAPTTCVAAVLVAPVLLAAVATVVFRPRPDVGLVSFLGVLLIVLAAIWLSAALRFRNNCLRREGWRLALAKYHLLALTICAGEIGLIAAVMWADSGTGWGRALIRPTLLIGSLAILAWAVMRGYRWAVDSIRPLQREVAVRLARDYLRKRLSRMGPVDE